jgi:hypothetical protein
MKLLSHHLDHATTCCQDTWAILPYVVKSLGHTTSSYCVTRLFHDATYGHIGPGLGSMLDNSLATDDLTININNDIRLQRQAIMLLARASITSSCLAQTLT